MHTPGPWRYHSGMVWKDDGTEDGFPIAKMDRTTPMTLPTERDANARLIALAPAMLTILRYFAESRNDSVENIRITREQARALLRELDTP